MSGTSASGATGLTVQVDVDGEPHVVPAFGTLADLVTALGHDPKLIATAVNGEFVARGSRREYPLRCGDRVTCFQAIVGG